MTLSASVSVLLAVLFCSSIVSAGDSTIEARFVSNVSSVHPGKPFKVGVLFNVQQPWHIYWKYPGEAGLPTRIKLDLPSGYSAGELMWPVPTEFRQEGNLAGYGYQGEVLLFSEITPPATIEYGSAARIKAEVRWVGCFNVCVPGRENLSLEVPVGAGGLASDAALFERWEHRLPWDYQKEKQLFAYRVKGENPAPGGQSDWNVTIEWPFAPQQVGFFPLPAYPYFISELKRETAGNATHVRFKLFRKPGLGSAAPAVQSVVSFDGGQAGMGAVSLPLTVE